MPRTAAAFRAKTPRRVFCKLKDKQECRPDPLSDFSDSFSGPVYLCPTAPQWDPELCHGAWINQSFSQRLAAFRIEALVCSTEFFFSPCAPHTPCTPGWLPERAAPKCMSPEPVDLTWKTDWARPPQQVRKSDAGTFTYCDTLHKPVVDQQGLFNHQCTDMHQGPSDLGQRLRCNTHNMLMLFCI